MKMLKLKFLTILIYTIISIVVCSQTDTNFIYYTNDILIYYNNGFIENTSMTTGEKTKIPDLKALDNIKRVRFLSDSLISVSNNKNIDLKIRVNKINAVNYKNGTYTAAGIGIGILAGIITGVAIGKLTEEKNVEKGWFYIDPAFIGGILGIPIGGLIGGIIGANISSYESFGINGNKYELEKVLAGYRNYK